MKKYKIWVQGRTHHHIGGWSDESYPTKKKALKAIHKVIKENLSVTTISYPLNKKRKAKTESIWDQYVILRLLYTVHEVNDEKT